MFSLSCRGYPLPRSYETHTKIWIKRDLHRVLKDFAEKYNVAMDDVIAAFYEFISNDLHDFLEFLKKKFGERENV